MIYTYRKNVFPKYTSRLDVIHRIRFRNKIKSMILVFMLLISSLSFVLITETVEASGNPPSQFQNPLRVT